MAKRKAPSGKIGKKTKRSNTGLKAITTGKKKKSGRLSGSKHKPGTKTGSKRKSKEISESSVEYPAKMVHAANERLRKLEKVSKLAESSGIYQNMKRQMYEQPNKAGKIFQSGKEKGSMRFISKTKFMKLTEEEQKYYLKRLASFMASDMSTASGLGRIKKKLRKANKDNEEARRQSYETFKERPEIKDKFPNLSFEQYTNLFHAYQYYTDVKGEHFNYDELTLFLENVDLDKLDPYQIEEAMSFVKDDNWGELIDRGWLLEF